MSWQIYWDSWGWSYSCEEDGDLEGVHYNVLILGPLQVRWFS